MPTKTRVALFIDAENASTKHLPDYLAHCNQLGKPTIVRCYGGSAGLKKWEKALAQHHIVPMLTPPSAAKENASDFALTIDAVSLLHRDMFDHAIIASSDADFTQLAMHIREHGKGVHGMGEAKATERLRDAFDEFITVGEKTARSAAAKKPAAPHQEEGPAAKRPDIDTKKLQAIYGELAAGGDPVTLQLFGRTLSKQMPNYKKGHRTLENFLKKSGRFEIAEGNVHLISGGKPGQIRP
jgi:hypothetical protein